MIITCPCGEKKFEVAESLIAEKGRLLKCGSCEHTWFFDKKSQQESHSTEREFNKKTSISINEENSLKKFKNTDNNTNLDDQKTKTKISKNKGSELIRYKPKSSFTIVNFLSYILVMIISFIGFLVLVDTFKSQLYDFYPDLETLMFSFYETLKDIQLFIKDLI